MADNDYEHREPALVYIANHSRRDAVRVFTKRTGFRRTNERILLAGDYEIFPLTLWDRLIILTTRDRRAVDCDDE